MAIFEKGLNSTRSHP